MKPSIPFCGQCGQKHSYQQKYRCRTCGAVFCSAQLTTRDPRWMYAHGAMGRMCGPVVPLAKMPVG